VKDEGYWAACLAVIKKIPPHIRVNYHGDIPPGEIEHVLSQNHIFILPSKSENFGHAIYEALSAGRPVITSRATPWNGLQPAKAGVNVATENITELVNAIQFFGAMKEDELAGWSNSAVNYAKAAIDLGKIREQYVEMFSC
jgi:glycosyltransferase involved in cell wall biosynthesis